MARQDCHDLNCLEGIPRYQKIRDLNKGTFGFVQLAWDKRTNPPQQVAIKFMDRGDKVTKYVEREIINHRLLLHPHIIQFREVFLTPRYLCIAMEFGAGGDLFDYVLKRSGLKEDEARWFFQQLIVAIDYCHRMCFKGVANRDVKLENTLLDGSIRPLLKICDFGYSKSNEDSIPKSKVGTPSYIAPEVIEDETYDAKIADIWSCGVMLYVMLVGAYPFERPTDKSEQKLPKMIQRILRVDYCIPSRVQISEECHDLLGKILVRDPQKRITIEGIQNHPWYSKNLPPGVKEMNNNLVVSDEGLQTIQQIERIVQDAALTELEPNSRIRYTHDSVDDFVDDVMDDDLRLGLSLRQI